MKTMILALTTLFTISAFGYKAPGPDQEYPIYTCQLEQPVADNDLRLSVVQGGFAGFTRVIVNESFFTGGLTSKFIVQQKPVAPNVRTTIITYTGKNIVLKIDTWDKDQDGVHTGYIRFVNEQGHGRTEKLACDMLRVARIR
ncbi:hypothetical protein [Bdellovibrio sp. HCB337]|uniref:hypothetical protein n=1 Tax=Bdellovibrio sp. HCB337 TaxID=3394358 RepID=UPI0039A51D5E